MSSSQNCRYIWMPEGNDTLSWVKAGNVMAVRTTLLCYLAAALGLVFILEQPGCSKFSLMPRWQHFCQTVCHVRRLQSVFFPSDFFLYITFVAVLRIVTVFGHFRYPRLPLTMAVTALDILESLSL